MEKWGTAGRPTWGAPPHPLPHTLNTLLMKLLSEGHRLFLNRDVASESRVLEPQQLSYRDPGCPQSAPRMCGELARDMHLEGFPILSWGWGLGCPLGKAPPSLPPAQPCCTPTGLVYLVPTRTHRSQRSPPRVCTGSPPALESRAASPQCLLLLPRCARRPDSAPARLPLPPTSAAPPPAAPAPPLAAPAPPPRPAHRLVEGLHHRLGIVGVVVQHGLLQGLVIELLHVLSNLGTDVVTLSEGQPRGTGPAPTPSSAPRPSPPESPLQPS